MSKKDQILFLNKVYQEAFWCRRLLDSCITIDQLNNACNFSQDIVNRWNFNFNKLSKMEQKKVFEGTNFLIKSIQDTYNCKCEEFNKAQQQEEEEKKKRIIVHGFCID